MVIYKYTFINIERGLCSIMVIGMEIWNWQIEIKFQPRMFMILGKGMNPSILLLAVVGKIIRQAGFSSLGGQLVLRRTTRN